MTDPLPTNYLFIKQRRRPVGWLLAGVGALTLGALTAAWLLWA